MLNSTKVFSSTSSAPPNTAMKSWPALLGRPLNTRPRTRILAHKAYFPRMTEQRAIGAMLGALDEKIELNRRMNQTLEAIARAIFKSWFVDFDPVRAKAAGWQPPGLAPAIADLFPDSFEDSELGGIPRGWHAANLGSIAAEARTRFSHRTWNMARPTLRSNTCRAVPSPSLHGALPTKWQAGNFDSNRMIFYSGNCGRISTRLARHRWTEFVPPTSW